MRVGHTAAKGRLHRWGLVAAILQGILLVTACNAISGIGDFQRVSENEGGGATSSVGGQGNAGGSGGGAGGFGGGSGCDGECVPAVDGATYVVIADGCDAGSTELDLLDCDACPCTAASGTCQLDVGSKLDDEDTCSGSGITVAGPGCVTLGSPYNAPIIYVKAQVSLATPGTCTPSADPAVTACQLTMPDSCDAGTGSNSGVCVPTNQATCLLVDDNSDCAAVDPMYTTYRTLQEGGTCNCTCQVNSDCPEEVILYSDGACANDITTVAANNACNYSGATSVGSVQAQAAVATCASSNSPNNGNPIRLCCLAQ